MYELPRSSRVGFADVLQELFCFSSDPFLSVVGPMQGLWVVATLGYARRSDALDEEQACDHS